VQVQVQLIFEIFCSIEFSEGNRLMRKDGEPPIFEFLCKIEFFERGENSCSWADFCV
jgi:hypothetical protein